jgi:hypothetical protein
MMAMEMKKEKNQSNRMCNGKKRRRKLKEL